MKQRYVYLLLGAILLLNVVIRLLLATQAESPSYESHNTLIQASHIHATGLPVYEDIYSFRERSIISLPFFYYLSALLLYFLPWKFVALAFPVVVSIAIVFLSYELSFAASKRQVASLYSAAAVAFLPVFSQGMFDFMPFTLSLLLLLAAAHLFIKIDGKNSISLLLGTLVVLVLSDAISLFLVVVFLFYVLLARLEKAGSSQIKRIELETIFLYTFFALWASVLFFKKALLAHGSLVIWQNLPSRIVELSFFNITFIQSFFMLGVLTVLLGCFGLFLALFKQKSRALLLVSSWVIVAFLMLWLKLMPFRQGMMLFGVGLAILSATALSAISEYVSKSKLSPFLPILSACTVMIILATNVVGSLDSGFRELEQLPSAAEFGAADWMKENIPHDAVVLATVREAPFIHAIAGRKTFLDTNFLLLPDANEKFNDAMICLDGGFVTPALERFKKYGISYIYISQEYERSFHKERPSYIEGSECFQKEFDNGIEIYSIRC